MSGRAYDTCYSVPVNIKAVTTFNDNGMICICYGPKLGDTAITFCVVGGMELADCTRNCRVVVSRKNFEIC